MVTYYSRGPRVGPPGPGRSPGPLPRALALQAGPCGSPGPPFHSPPGPPGLGPVGPPGLLDLQLPGLRAPDRLDHLDSGNPGEKRQLFTYGELNESPVP